MPASPVYPYGEPTPADELRPGDKVINVHTGREATWKGRNGLGAYSVESLTGTIPLIEDGHWRFVSRPEPADEPEPRSAPESDGPQTHIRDDQGRIFATGQRITHRTRDGFLNTGVINAVHTVEGRPTAEFTVDTTQIAPARSRGGITHTTRPARRVDPPKTYSIILDRSVNPAR